MFSIMNTTVSRLFLRANGYIPSRSRKNAIPMKMLFIVTNLNCQFRKACANFSKVLLIVLATYRVLNELPASENRAGNTKPTGTSIMMKLNDEYLALTAKLAHDIKTASYLQLKLRPGSRHLEIGSGNGHDTIALAELNPASSILGIDLNDDIVQVANQRVRDKGLTNVTHVTGDATFYPFNGKFHSMRAERVFQHLKDAEIVALVKRLATLAEQDCVFSLAGIDWETLTCTIPAKHRDMFRTIKQFLIDGSNINFVHTAIAAFEIGR